jgi:ketosteroid isomerase-like protein
VARVMDDRSEIIEASEHMATAIARRDLSAIRALLAPGFVHRTIGGAAIDVDAFVRGIEQIPGDIVFVRLEQLEVDVSGGSALVTGVQHAQVRMDGKLVDDRRSFVDWFVRDSGYWRIRVAIDLPA